MSINDQTYGLVYGLDCVQGINNSGENRVDLRNFRVPRPGH